MSGPASCAASGSTRSKKGPASKVDRRPIKAPMLSLSASGDHLHQGRRIFHAQQFSFGSVVNSHVLIVDAACCASTTTIYML